MKGVSLSLGATRMSVQKLIARMLLVGGAVAAWAGPDHGVREDGTPLSPGERHLVRLFGFGLVACGAVVLVATVLGFRGEPLNGLPAP
jgi:hypothetical protein